MVGKGYGKVFKSAIEEERQGTLFSNLSLTYEELPGVSTRPAALLSNLQKNTTWFSDQSVFSLKPGSFIVKSPQLLDFSSFFSYQLPFNLSNSSDILRHAWFDWFSIRNSITTKALDLSLYGLHGSKVSGLNFSRFGSLELLNRRDSYINKFSYARRLYIPMYTYAPFFFFRSFQLGLTLDFNKILPSSNLTRLSNLSNILYRSQMSFFYLTSLPTPLYSLSGAYDTSLIRNYTINFNVAFNLRSSVTHLINILSLRDFYYRNLFLLKRSFANIYLNEYVSYDTKSIIRDISQLSSATNVHNSTSKLLNYTKRSENFNIIKQNPLTPDETLTRTSQYQSFRKGVSNLIRLQADKAVAMPIEIRLQILATSKDIIHS